LVFRLVTYPAACQYMLHVLRVNFENYGHTTKNKIFRLVKLLAALSTRLNICHDFIDGITEVPLAQINSVKNNRNRLLDLVFDSVAALATVS